MPQAKLILVEGVPGSGKSTTAQHLARQLRRHGLNGRWWYEEEVPHPIRPGSGVAPAGWQTPDDFMAVLLANWRSFVAQALPAAEVTVLESWLFQDPIAALLRRDVAAERILHAVRALTHVAKALAPVLLYLDRPNVEDALHTICTRRGQAWEAFHIRRLNDTPFAKRRGVSGLQGLLRFWEEHKALADRLVEEFDGDKLILDRSQGAWADYHRDIAAWLALPFVEDQTLPESLLNKYVGAYTYREEKGERRIREFALRLEGQALTG